MKKLLTAVVLAGTLLSVAATPLAANAAPVTNAPHAAHVLGGGESVAKMRAELHDIALSGWQQVILGASKHRSPNQVPVRSGVPFVSLKVTGSNWSTFKVTASSSFLWNAANKDFTLKKLQATYYNSGKYTYNF